MDFIRGLHNMRSQHQGCVATIGNFDGVHRGHQAIIAQLLSKSRELQLPSLVMVFEPQPREFFTPEQAPARLTTVREKSELLYESGVDRVMIIRFNKVFCSQSAHEFCKNILLDGLGVKHLVVGDDFRFGSDRCGDFEFLQRFGSAHGFTVEDTESHLLDDTRVSSTQVRNALAASDFAQAERLLGRIYGMSGRVVHGDKIGRTLSFPTANVLLNRLKSPLNGVFLVSIEGIGDQLLPAVANVGLRPTVNGHQSRIEAHLLNFDQNIYGRRVHVMFHKKIRAEKKFNNLDELKKNIQLDIENAKAFFNL
ncbi:MAG: bifunctional riboflavin kinase/FMN adenylyltransferase [Gammaproteobacteria bacterium]|nr:MAG: bifunctional riboflavin kinase/FMN adenylyltransferase [Gammaproteobacteria bacterium]